MIDLEKEKRTWRRSKLRAGIVKRLSANQWWYLKQLREYFYWPTDSEFDSVVTELILEGAISRTEGRDGGIKLSLVKTEAAHV